MAHWTEGLTNVSDSVRQRLRNVARETNENMQVVLIRYATERLLYRLSLSEHCEQFILKGAWLFHVWNISRRATRDVDFLASVSNVAETVRDIFREVIGVEVPHDDGLTYDADSLQAEEIQLDADYSGVRLRMIAMLGATRIQTQIDLGFSEAVVEEPTVAVLPVLLDFEAPEIKAYSPEVVVAEKVEAIVKLGTVTTRFKDFFDLILLSEEKTFDGPKLLRQVSATFEHRGTPLPAGIPVALTDEFARRSGSQKQWEAFLHRNGAEGAPEQFEEVVKQLRAFICPVLHNAAGGGEMHQVWGPASGWKS